MFRPDREPRLVPEPDNKAVQFQNWLSCSRTLTGSRTGQGWLCQSRTDSGCPDREHRAGCPDREPSSGTGQGWLRSLHTASRTLTGSRTGQGWLFQSRTDSGCPNQEPILTVLIENTRLAVSTKNPVQELDKAS